MPEKFEIFNLATGARSITEGSEQSITNDKNYEHIKKSQADAFIFSFGINDANNKNWVNKEHFEKSYTHVAQDLIGELGGDVSRFFMMTSPPHCKGFNEWVFSTPEEAHEERCNVDIPQVMPKIKAELKVPDNNYIDMFALLGGAACNNPEYFCQESD